MMDWIPKLAAVSRAAEHKTEMLEFVRLGQMAHGKECLWVLLVIEEVLVWVALLVS